MLHPEEVMREGTTDQDPAHRKTDPAAVPLHCLSDTSGETRYGVVVTFSRCDGTAGHRSGRLLAVAAALLVVTFAAGCTSGDREAAEATASIGPAASQSVPGSASPDALFADGSRVCLINRSSQTFDIEPLVFKEKSANTSLSPGGDYCQAGYVEGDHDTDLRATNQGTKLHIYAENPGIGQPWAGAKQLVQGNYEQGVVFSQEDKGIHKRGTTSDGRFDVDIYRVDDCCGWKQWRLEIMDAPTG